MLCHSLRNVIIVCFGILDFKNEDTILKVSEFNKEIVKNSSSYFASLKFCCLVWLLKFWDLDPSLDPGVNFINTIKVVIIQYTVIYVIITASCRNPKTNWNYHDAKILELVE